MHLCSSGAAVSRTTAAAYWGRGFLRQPAGGGQCKGPAPPAGGGGRLWPAHVSVVAWQQGPSRPRRLDLAARNGPKVEPTVAPHSSCGWILASRCLTSFNVAVVVVWSLLRSWYPHWRLWLFAGAAGAMVK